MRRRQAFSENPPGLVQTVAAPINEAKPPEIAPRRRMVLAQQFNTAVDISDRLVEQFERNQGMDIENVEFQTGRPILTLPHKKHGRPAKNKQAS